jgi:hypothetical protein
MILRTIRSFALKTTLKMPPTADRTRWEVVMVCTGVATVLKNQFETL